MLLLILVCSGCAATPQMYEFDVSNCDPRERRNCISIKGETISALSEMIEENERLHAAVKFCQKRL